MKRTVRKPEGPRCLFVKRHADSYTKRVEVIVAEQASEDSEHANDGKRYSVRTPEESGDLYLSRGELALTAWVQEDSPLLLNYNGLEYRDVHSANAEQCEAMARTLRMLEKRSRKLSDDLGYANGFAEVVMRVAAMVGAKMIAFDRRTFTLMTGEETPRAHDPQDYAVFCELSTARRYLDSIARHNDSTPKAQAV